MVELHLAKVDVAGSSPVSRSKSDREICSGFFCPQIPSTNMHMLVPDVFILIPWFGRKKTIDVLKILNLIYY